MSDTCSLQREASSGGLSQPACQVIPLGSELEPVLAFLYSELAQVGHPQTAPMYAGTTACIRWKLHVGGWWVRCSDGGRFHRVG